MKKKNKVLISIIIGILTIILVPIAFSYWFASGFVNKPNPEYSKYVSERINFSTTRIDNTLQWDTIQNRINSFFETNPEYKVPDSIQVKEQICNGCTRIQKVVFFQSKPNEIYRVNFGMGFNYIDEIYKLEDEKYKELLTNTFDAKEKNRIKSRLEIDVLDKINWNVKEINFSRTKE